MLEGQFAELVVYSCEEVVDIRVIVFREDCHCDFYQVDVGTDGVLCKGLVYILEEVDQELREVYGEGAHYAFYELYGPFHLVVFVL